MPGSAAGTASRKQASVSRATSRAGARFAAWLPESTMLGLSSMPSNDTR